MSWELRNGRWYFYRVERKQGRLVKRYCGGGLAGMLAAKEVKTRANHRVEQIRLVREFEATMWHLDSVTRLIREASRDALHATYIASGFVQNQFYHWRKQRSLGVAKKKGKGKTRKPQEPEQGQQQEPAQQQGCNKADTPETSAKSQLPTSINQTIEAIQQGRSDLIDHLRSQLRQQPKVWQHCGDLGRLTQAAWTRQIAGDEHLVRESIMLRVDQQREELAGPNPTAATRLMVERVVLGNLQLTYFEQLLAQNANEMLGSRLGDHLAQRLKSANFELREASRHLAKVQELQAEANPRRPAAALKLFDPDQKRRTA